MSLSEKIREIEEEIKKTQKNKATEHHIGLLKAKLAKLRRELISSSSKKGSGQGFAIRKSGTATVALVGFPSVGKSTLLSLLTNAESKSASYAFTTLTCIPGTLFYKGARIQILDLPGIVEGASDGRGRGKEVISVARNSDMVLIVLDPFNPLEQYRKIVKELKQLGIRLNKQKPNISIIKKERGGIIINRLGETELSDRTVCSILHEYRIFNAEVLLPKNANADDLIDVLEGNRVYLPALIVVNKADLFTPHNLPSDWLLVSCAEKHNIEALKELIFEKLNLIRIYTKKKGEKPDEEPLLIRKGSKVRDVCLAIHRDLLERFKYARVWGKSAKHPGQRVGIEHELEDGDVVEISAK